MPTQLTKPSIQFMVLLVGILLLTVFAFGLSSSGLSSDGEVEATGHLDVAGVVYEFAPTTCTITDDDFVAAGIGEIGDETFWISASSDSLNLAVGAENDVDRPEADDLWLISVEEISWRSDGDALTATAFMQDERDATAKPVFGALDVECASA